MDILMMAAAVCAYFVKGMCGFANTLVFSTILGFRANNIDITPLELILGYPSNLIIAWKERKSVQLRIWLPLAAMVIAGLIPGTFFLKMGDTTVIKLIFGVVVTGIGTEMLLRDRAKKGGKASKAVLALIGLASGLMCGLFGIGALLAAYVGRTTEDSSAFRGNMCMVFVVENTFRIILYSCVGIINLEVLKSALILVPCMAVGLGGGMLMSKVLDEKKVRKVVIIMLILSGLSLVINNIVKLFA